MIENVWAKNYRSLKDIQLTLEPLTVLVGENGAGKSNLVDVLRFLSDALLFGLDVTLFQRMGINQLYRWVSEKAETEIEIGISLRQPTLAAQYCLVLGKSNPQRRTGAYEIKAERCVVTQQGKQTEFHIQNGQWLSQPSGISFPILPTSLFLPFMAGLPPFKEVYETLTGMSFYDIRPSVVRGAQPLANPYPLDIKGKNLAAVLFELEQTQKVRVAELTTALTYVLPEISRYVVENIGSHLVIKLQHEMNDHLAPWFELTQESDGTLRILGILTALYQQPARTLIAIEEADIALHPNTIVRLWDELTDASAHSQILLTTHSPELLDLCRAEQLRILEKIDGDTYVGTIDKLQKEIIQEKLASPGQLLKAQGALLRAIGD
jgi:predicted ATPase